MSLIRDVRYAVRSLLRQPGFSAVTVVTLALGLGINTAVFAVAYGILWRPLPYPEPSRLVTVTNVNDGDGLGVDLAALPDWLTGFRTVQIAGHHTQEQTVRGAGAPRVVHTTFVTVDFFEVLGVPAARGVIPRLEPAAGRVVISAALAAILETATGASALGQAVTIGDRRYDVASVMPLSFAFPSGDVDAWVPAPAVASEETGTYHLVGRIRDGLTLAQVREDANRVGRDIRGAEWSGLATVVTIEEALLGDAKPALQVSIAAALLVLLVACANTITLMVGRSVVRRREFAVRLALGSGTRRLVRTAMIESLLIATTGLGVGMAVALAGLRVFMSAAAGVLPRLDAITIDLPVLLAVLAVTLLVAVVCGGASVSGVVRHNGAELLRGTVMTGTPATRHLRAGLVAAQLALSIVLLTGTGLLARSVGRLLGEEGGFEPRNVLTAKLMLSDTRFIDGVAETPFVNELLARVRVLPGVQAAGVGSTLPPTVSPITLVIRYTSDTRDDSITLSFGSVTSGYFAALGTPLLGGRRFEARDEVGEVTVAILSASAARFIHADEDAVGRTMRYSFSPMLGLTRDSPVIGVVDDIKYQGLDAPRGGAVYVPWHTRPFGVSYLVVRTTGAPAQLAPVVRDIIRDLNPALPVPDVQTLEDHLAASIADRRLRLVPAAGFAVIALAVTLVGLFGTLARAVTERRQELAIRAAIGASPARIVRLVMSSSLIVTGIGLAVGLGAAAAAGRGLAGLLYGVSPYDPMTFAAVAGLVVAAALAASIIPARRAARLDPMIALRAE
ncbi:MAG: ABC transporter permease [Acidobacteria bacterium]|nr:ABC transporter permease [Acidobacteriota bacterium]